MESLEGHDIPADINANVRKRSKSLMSYMNEFDDIIKRTSLIDLHESSIQGNSGNNTFSISNSPITCVSKIKTPDIFSSPIQESSTTIKKELWRKPASLSSSRRKRRFGSSCIDSALPRLSKIMKLKTSPRMEILKCCKKNFKIFSTCVTPCPSPSTGFASSHIFRLSGISMSPSTPIAWMSQSPVELDSFSSINSFFSKSSPKSSLSKSITSPGSTKSSIATSSSQRLQVSDDSCPPDKLYFWQDDASELIADDKLGAGGFGQVFEGTFRGAKVAIKKMKNEFTDKKATFENFIGEVMSLRLSHPNLVRSLVLIQPANSPLTPGSKGASYLVMELAGTRNLQQIINDANEVLSSTVKVSFYCDILKGLLYLHDNGMAHLDLKPGNVIVTSQNLCKICDFGSCKLVELTLKARENLAFASFMCSKSCTPPPVGMSFTFPNTSGQKNFDQPSLLLGTLIYRAPELLEGIEPSLKADIFSFGITAWQIWQRSEPYPGLHQHTAVYSIVAFGRRPKIPKFNENSDRFEVEFADILQKCWSRDPTQRPTSKEVLDEVLTLLSLFPRSSSTNLQAPKSTSP